jgi:hypothetical protein|tara:strand:+ start:1396 stop:1734 length:339 start_codon:yes stop_codon:yes gene_type:complete
MGKSIDGRMNYSSLKANNSHIPNELWRLDVDSSTNTHIEAAVFRRLLAHLDDRKDVQNIDLMDLAGFCRNCLSKWYREAAREKDIDMDYEAAKQIVYGMPYEDWKEKYQTER